MGCEADFLMNIIRHKPETQTEWQKIRHRCISSTESAALFGLSPYMTEFELFHRKKSPEPVSIEGNERVKWGNRLEAAIAAGVAEENGWTVEPFKEYLEVSDIRMGSSFDYRIVATGSEHPGPGILEIKNVDSLIFRDNWVKNGEKMEAPEHIEVQLQHQMHVSGYSWACIAALVGGNKLEMIFRKRDDYVCRAIERRVRRFWQRFDANQEPVPDFIRDAETISRLYGYAEPGKVLDASGNDKIASLCARYSELGNIEKNASEEREGIKAELLTLIGDSERVIANGFSITAGVIGPTHVEYDRAGYRSFRITKKKVKV